MILRIKKNRIKNTEINPDEIFIDSHNLPNFNNQQFEGRIERPISKISLFFIFLFFILILLSFGIKIFMLQVKDGEIYVKKSENNRLRHTPIFAVRGIIYDRNGVELAWNEPTNNPDLFLRRYKTDGGFSHTVGYVQYPSKDSAGFYYQEDFQGVAGAEKFFNKDLQGINGVKLIEVNSSGKIQSSNIVESPKEGVGIYLSIDSRIQNEMYSVIKEIADRNGFTGGAGILMDTITGEVIAITSYPEYDSEVMSIKTDTLKVKGYLNSINKPFLNRAVDGLYTPGSIIKPFIALAALNENIISPEKKILSTGSISIQNKYYPDLKTIFKDWKVHGWVDMRRAIAVSSDVYFYTIGGGYQDQKGLGITQIEKYLKSFGFGEKIKNPFFIGPEGIVPNPTWKKKNFNGEDWSLGNTYHTVIGQYGSQVSAIQEVRALSAITNDGLLRDPSILKDKVGEIIRQINIPKNYFNIVKEGMIMGTTKGTGVILNVPYTEVATKSGTAELGSAKERINSWMTGYFPYKNPHYAFSIILEKGYVEKSTGAGPVMRKILDWMSINTPEYFK